jgi:hypothetical protein
MPAVDWEDSAIQAENQTVECKVDRKAVKCVGPDVSFIVAKTLVAVMKSFDPSGAIYNLRLSAPINIACRGEKARRGGRYSPSVFLLMQKENSTTGQHAKYIRWFEEMSVVSPVTFS